MRFDFTNPAPVVLAAEGEGDRPRRTISGRAVPWGKVGKVSSGQLVKFEPGSVTLMGEALIRDHDRTRPIGVVATETNTDDGLDISTRISATAHGDEALILANDGVLRFFSVGVNPTKYRFEDSPEGSVLVVEEAEADEVSILVRGAFGADAAVTSVAASEPTQEAPVPDPIEATPVASVVPITASPSKRVEPLTMQRFTQIIASAPHGGVQAAVQQALIEAATSTTGALENILSTQVASIGRPAFLTEILGLINFGRPLVDAIASAPLPPSGMAIQWPRWKTLPTVDIQATEKTAIATGPVDLETLSTNVVTFAGGNDISIQAAQRTNPSFLDAYFRAAAEMMARRENVYVATALLADAAAATPGADFVANLEALLGALDPTVMPDGPLFLALAWDVGIGLVGMKDADKPAFWSGSISFGNLVNEVSADGLNIFVDRSLPAGTYLMGAKNAAVWHEDPANPYEVRVVDVSLLGIDAGVYGFAALREAYDWTKTMAKITVAP